MLFRKKDNNFLTKEFYYSFFLILIFAYLIIGFTFLSLENGDEGFYLRIIAEIIDGKTFLKDFATNMPVVIMYIFFPLKFITTNYFIGSRFIIGILNFFTFFIIFRICRNNNNYYYIILYLILFFFIFLTSDNLFYYSFEIRQWPVIYFLQVMLVYFFYNYSHKQKLSYIFLIGFLLGIITSSRQTYLIFFPAVFSILLFYDYCENKINRKLLKKYLLLVLGYCVSASIFFSILFYDIDFALGLWYFLNQDIHFSNKMFSLYDTLLFFIGHNQNTGDLNILVFSSVIIYIYLIFDIIQKVSLFKLLVFATSSIIIFSTFFGWSHGYHKEVFYILFVYLLLSNNNKKNIFSILLTFAVLIIMIFNIFLNNNVQYFKNYNFLKNSLNNLISINFDKFDFYSDLNKELDKICTDEILTWDTRRGRLLSSNSKCRGHPKVVNQYLTTGIMHRNIYKPHIYDKIFSITLRPEELIFFILNDADLILANDIDDLLNEINIIIKRNSLDDIMFEYFCKNNCVINDARSINLKYFNDQIHNIISESFTKYQKLDITFFKRNESKF